MVASMCNSSSILWMVKVDEIWWDSSSLLFSSSASSSSSCSSSTRAAELLGMAVVWFEFFEFLYRRRACTQVLFLRKAELGFFHFLQTVTGWLVPSAGKKIPLAEKRFLQAGKGAENIKEKSRQCYTARESCCFFSSLLLIFPFIEGKTSIRNLVCFVLT